MNVKLDNIAEIQFGPYEKGQDEGSVKYLLAGHFDDFYQPTKFTKSYIHLSEKTDKFLLQTNDVILAGKGQRIFAWAYNDTIGKAVPSSLFYILRANVEYILAEYLAYYLNSEKMQFELKSIGAGATITSIPKKELENLSLVIPSIDEQKRIIKLGNLLDKDVELTAKLLENKKNLKRGLINKLITNQISVTKTKKKP
jgi:restriction endonuclease S subunit